MVNQAILASYRYTPKYKYGYLIPRDYQEAIKLDEKFGVNQWKEATNMEMDQLEEYDVFIDKGHKDNINKILKELEGYMKIRTHLAFDVKHDGRHKTRMVADGHLTEVPL